MHVDECMADKLKQFYILTWKRDMKSVNDALTDIEVIFEEKIGESFMVFAYYKNKDKK
jgi:hypothetical protein